jgi:hypothetical protein
MIATKILQSNLKSYILNCFSNGQPPNRKICTHIAARNILESVFGFQVVRYIFPNDNMLENSYFNLELELVAESVLNVHQEKGFDSIVRNIIKHHKTKASVDHDLAALLSARLMSRVGMNITFVEQTGNFGFDYDLLSKTNDGSDLTIEVKCKQINKISLRTYLGSLKEADEQMNTTGTKMIFIKAPLSWTSEPEFEKIIYSQQSMVQTFKNDTVLMWYEWYQNNWALRLFPSISVGENGDRMHNKMMYYLEDREFYSTPNNNFIYLNDLATNAFLHSYD